jgi:hypothetical protein
VRKARPSIDRPLIEKSIKAAVWLQVSLASRTFTRAPLCETWQSARWLSVEKISPLLYHNILNSHRAPTEQTHTRSAFIDGMNFSTEQMSAAMSPFLSGTASPIPGNGGFPHQQNINGASTSQMPQSMAMVAAMNAANSGHASPALAYANAQLAQFAQQHQQSLGQMQPTSTGHFTHSNNANLSAAQFASLFNHSTGGVPSNLNPHALSAALADYSSQSMPNSAPSSPGAQHRRLHAASALGYPSGTMTGTNTPGGHSRVATSAITGKRLNWSEMICQTIAESESGRLVIQDLFEQMCAKFPEIREWAFGKDWEGRVKNRIKSTLSIKGNLFIKVPRPSSASGKGSWWTLSQEAQDAWKEGRVASVVKSGTHSRSASQGRAGFDGLSMSTATSRANSRAPSRRGSPVSSRGPSSHHAQSANQHNQNAIGRNSVGNGGGGYVNFGSNLSGQNHADNLSHSSPSTNSQGDSSSRRQSPSSGLPASLGMSPINFSSTAASTPFDNLKLGSGLSGFDGLDDASSSSSSNQQAPNAQQMRMMENSVNNNYNVGNSGMNNNNNSNNGTVMPSATSLGMASMAAPAGDLYSISPYNAFSTSAAAQHFGNIATAAHMGGPQSMPFPASNMQLNSTTGGLPAGMNANAQNSANNGTGFNDPTLSNFVGDPTFGAFAGLDLSSIDGLNNPFGSMAGGYTMLGEGQTAGSSGAQPTAIPGRTGGNHNGDTGSGDRGTPSASSFNAAFFSGPSPADSTGSTSAFFAYTPAMQAADLGSGGGGSALGPVGGEGSRRKQDASSGQSSNDFALPPTDQQNDGAASKA